MVAAALCALACGCGGDDDGGADDGDTPDAGADADAAGATACNNTRIETIPLPDRYLGDAAMTLSPAGLLEVAFAMADGEEEAVFVTSRGPQSWLDPEPVSGAIGGSSPDMVLAPDGTLHLVWNYTQEGAENRDLFYASRPPGDAWTAPVNLTSSFESSQQRDARFAFLALGPDEELVAAYMSADHPPDGGDITMSEIRVIVIEDGVVSGPPVTAIPRLGLEGCYNRTGVEFDGDGTLHIVSQCGDTAPEDVFLYQAVRVDGVWREPDLVASDIASDPDLAVGPDGQVHAVWATSVPCEAGAEPCWHIHHAIARVDRFSPPALIADPDPRHPYGPAMRVAIGPDGRVLVVYGPEGLFLVDSPDGVTFSRPCRLVREPEGHVIRPVALQFDPDRRAHLLFSETLEAGDEPPVLKYARIP
jgi:hypothetical protein